MQQLIGQLGLRLPGLKGDPITLLLFLLLLFPLADGADPPVGASLLSSPLFFSSSASSRGGRVYQALVVAVRLLRCTHSGAEAREARIGSVALGLHRGRVWRPGRARAGPESPGPRAVVAQIGVMARQGPGLVL